MAKRKTATARKRGATRPRKAPKGAGCAVPGCNDLALEQVEGPGGKVWLCGRCAERARVDLRQAELRAEALDIAAAPYERAMAQRELRKTEQVQRQFGGAALLG